MPSEPGTGGPSGVVHQHSTGGRGAFACFVFESELRWYDNGHVITDPAVFVERARFLADHLALMPA